MADTLLTRLRNVNENHRAVGAVVFVLLVLLLSSYLLLYKLGSEPLQDYDEATYAEVTVESLANHHFLTFTFLGNSYFNKPPLLFWLMDISNEFVTQTEDAQRLPSALSGILLVAVVMLVIYEASRSISSAAFGGAILATTSAFIEPARQARFDILVSLFIILSVYAFMRALENRRWFLWFGIFVGLGVLAKGPIELFAVVAVLGIACAYRRFDWFLDPYFWGGVGLSLLIALPWHIYETVKFGEYFWDVYLDGQVIERIKEPLFTIGPTNLQYLQYIFEFAAPWAATFCASLVAAPFVWKKLVTKERALFVGSVVGVVSVIAVCFITQTKAFSYLIPLYPFMVAAIAIVVLGISRFHIPGIRTGLVIFFGCLLVVGIQISVYNDFHINTYYASEVALAQEEKIIGETLRTHHSTQFYIYDTVTLGSIMYYSRIITPEYLSTSTPPGSYLLYQTAELPQLETAYPSLHLASVYQGASLTLAVIE